VGLGQQPGGRRGVTLAPGPAEQDGQRDQPLLHTVVQVALDAPAFAVHRPHDAGPARGEFGDPAPQHLVLGGPEVPAGQPRVEPVEGGDALQVEEEQHAAEYQLAEQVPAAERAAQQPAHDQHGQHETHPEQAQHDAGEQPGTDAGQQVGQRLPGRWPLLTEEQRAAAQFDGDEPVGPHPGPAPGGGSRAGPQDGRQ
jgi:hypothetical protein